jgi:hypothetical protein
MAAKTAAPKTRRLLPAAGKSIGSDETRRSDMTTKRLAEFDARDHQLKLRTADERE